MRTNYFEHVYNAKQTKNTTHFTNSNKYNEKFLFEGKI